MSIELGEFNRNVGRWVDAQDLTAGQKNTLRLLAYKAGMHDWRHDWRIGKMEQWSRSVTAKKLGIKAISRRTLERHLAVFEELGLVARKRRGRRTHAGDNRKISNEYVFRFDRAYVGGQLVEFDFRTGQTTPLASVASNDLQEPDKHAGEEMRHYSEESEPLDRSEGVTGENVASNDLGIVAYNYSYANYEDDQGSDLEQPESQFFSMRRKTGSAGARKPYKPSWSLD